MDIGWTANLVALVTSILSAGMVYGVIREKMRFLERELETIKENSEAEREKVKDTFVAFHHFKDVVAPMQSAINEIQNDVKKLLLLSGKER